ncbi:MAG: hypothetical protein IKN59_08350 [Paludibacteraceae bacterium]|nr:hypothetical protein [Paludibacteraceae bacterium]
MFGNSNGFQKRQFVRMCAALILATLFTVVVIALTGCNVTRTITTTAQTVQKGDTTTVITTRTVESVDGKVDATKFINR